MVGGDPAGSTSPRGTPSLRIPRVSGVEATTGASRVSPQERALREDPLSRPFFGGEEEELQLAHSYQKSLWELRNRHGGKGKDKETDVDPKGKGKNDAEKGEPW